MSDYTAQLSALLQNDPIAGRLHTIPILIYCAKREELTLALEALKIETDLVTLEEMIVDQYETHFQIGHLEVKSGTGPSRKTGIIEFYIVCGPRQGPESAAAAASRIMTLYQPQFALSIGICGGVQGEINLTDILFATSAVNYEAGKKNEDGTFEMDLPVIRVEDHVIDEVKRLITTDTTNIWKEGCMITGSAVRKDVTSLLRTLEARLPRDIKGLDMEASAFFTACRVCHVKALPVIKGVSDMGDGQKRDDTHRFCMRRAVVAALKFLGLYFSHRQGEQYWKKN